MVVHVDAHGMQTFFFGTILSLQNTVFSNLQNETTPWFRICLFDAQFNHRDTVVSLVDLDNLQAGWFNVASQDG